MTSPIRHGIAAMMSQEARAALAARIAAGDSRETGMDTDAMFGSPEPRRYEPPRRVFPAALVARALREVGAYVVAQADHDRARAEALDACQRMLDVAIRDAAVNLDAIREAGL